MLATTPSPASSLWQPTCRCLPAPAVRPRPQANGRGAKLRGSAAAGPAEGATASCPFAAASAALQGWQQGAAQQQEEGDGAMQTPGPSPFSLQSLMDVR